MTGIRTSRLVGLAIIVNLLINATVSIIALFTGYHLTKNFYDFGSKAELFIVAVFAAPLLETLLFQHLIITASIKITARLRRMTSYSIAIVISAILFGWSHSYNPGYIIAATIMGLSFGLFYLYMKINGKQAFWLTALVHSANNLIILGIRELTENLAA